MKSFLLIITVLLFITQVGLAQADSTNRNNDSLNESALLSYKLKLAEIEKQRVVDSLGKSRLEYQLMVLKAADESKRVALQKQLKELSDNESNRIAQKKSHIDSLRKSVMGYPVYSPLKDTLFLIYAKMGASTPKERAMNITNKIKILCKDNFMKIDSILPVESDDMTDIAYKDMIIMTISEMDALWNNKSESELAKQYSDIIKNAVSKTREEDSIKKLGIRIGLVILVIAGAWLMIWLISKAYLSGKNVLTDKKDKWLKSLSFKDYTFLTIEQEINIIYFLIKILKWVLIVLLLYLILPMIFSIFPFTRGWADTLFNLIWTPFKGIFVSVWEYLPNIFTILVIYFIMRYFIRFVRYVFKEIEAENLKISGFHTDWAMPTFGIARFFLYAFMFILIFPYLPGSDSNIFRGVSVFLGILFSLGSSSAIANMIAGLVITYMRPYKIGDRIKIADLTGDVIEKTMLVTRLRTIKNEEITIPNSAVLSGNTINYSAYSKNEGLIIHTTVTIGYDVPWKDMHQALIDAALRTNLVLKESQPFVLQTSLDDFYVSYQLNAYIKESNKQAVIYSDLHQNIQDICNERGIEILSPHYRYARDGNATTIPVQYLPEGYESPAFKVKIENKSTI